MSCTASYKGLDLRSPDDRLTFRNRVAKELQRESLSYAQAMASILTGELAETYTRTSAIKAIANARIAMALSFSEIA